MDVSFESLAEVICIVGLRDKNRSAVDAKKPGVGGSELESDLVEIPGVDFCFSLNDFISANTYRIRVSINIKCCQYRI